MLTKSAHKIWKRLLLFGVGAAACVLVYLFLLNFQPIGKNSQTAGLIPVLVLAIGTALLTAWFLHADQLSPAILGLTVQNRPFFSFGVGILAGSAVTGLWFGIVALSAGATWHLNSSVTAVGILIAGFFAFFNNVGEELVYRGYAFVRLADHWGEAATIVFTSGIFAALHLQAGLPWLSVLAGVFTTGLVFGAIFARWRSLPLTLGMHVATNIVQEAAGLRPSAASIIMPEYSGVAAVASPTLWAGIATLNLILAFCILLVGRRDLRKVLRPNKSLERTRER